MGSSIDSATFQEKTVQDFNRKFYQGTEFELLIQYQHDNYGRPNFSQKSNFGKKNRIWVIK
jgi:hypothetical protein